MRSIIDLAHGLGCMVTAEGVETAPACRWLAHAGCDDAQGFLFSRPMVWPALLDPHGAKKHNRSSHAPAYHPEATTAGQTH